MEALGRAPRETFPAARGMQIFVGFTDVEYALLFVIRYIFI